MVLEGGAEHRPWQHPVCPALTSCCHTHGKAPRPGLSSSSYLLQRWILWNFLSKCSFTQTFIQHPSQTFASWPDPTPLSMSLAHTHRHIRRDFKSSQTAFGEAREVTRGKSITHMLGVEWGWKKGDRMEIIFRGDKERSCSPRFTNAAVSSPYVHGYHDLSFKTSSCRSWIKKNNCHK